MPKPAFFHLKVDMAANFPIGFMSLKRQIKMKNKFFIRLALLVICAIHFSFLTVAQKTKPSYRLASVDSLWNIWQDNTKADTIRLAALNQFTSDGYLYSNPDSAYYFAQLEYAFAKSKGLKKQMSSALNLQGLSYHLKGNNLKAMELYKKSQAIDIALGNKKGIARTLLNIGNIYETQGNYPKALEHYHKSLMIMEEIGDKKGIANSLISIGIIYYNQGDYPLALEHYQKGMKIFEELSNKQGIARSLHSIGIIYHEQGNYFKGLEYYQKSSKIFEELGDKRGISGCMNGIGNIFNEQGNYSKALEYHQKCLDIDEELGDKEGVAASLYNIGIIYERQKNYPTTLEYYQKSLSLEEELGNKHGIANSLGSLGSAYGAQGNYSKALEYYEKGLVIEEELGEKYGIATSLNSIGTINKIQGNFPKALEYYQKCLAIRQELGDKRGIAGSFKNIGRIYHLQGNYPKALHYCQRGLVLAKSIDVLEEQKSACECLYETYKAMGKGNEALVYLEQMNEVNDSLNANETSKKLQQMEFAKQVSKDSIATVKKEHLVQEAHQVEISQEKQTRNWSIAGGLLALLLATGFYIRWSFVKKSRAALQIEKDRSENLLLNILPEEIAKELKEKGQADARDFDMVSILFSDFKEFTQISEKLGAAELVNEINRCFEAFDGIMEKYGIEKIKTIGDAYMAAGGVPVTSENSVMNTALAALEMQEFVCKRKAILDYEGKLAFEMRVGIHTGPVVAGIVGVKKFQYDIWGDTVNTANRMESSGEVGKVNISEATYKVLKDNPELSFENRGKIATKGKGEMEMYFVSKTELKT